MPGNVILILIDARLGAAVRTDHDSHTTDIYSLSIQIHIFIH